MTNRLSKEEYDQMSSKIVELSVSLWDDKLEDTEEAIKLDDLWSVLDEYLKPKEDGKISD